MMSWLSEHIGPSLAILFVIGGPLLGAIGAAIIYIDSDAKQKTIINKTSENAELSQQIAKKSTEIAELYKQISSQSGEIAELNKQIAGSVTGGNSFCYLMPIPSFTEVNTLVFNLNHFGDYPMYDVRILVFDDTKNEDIDYGAVFEKYYGFRQRTMSKEEFLSKHMSIEEAEKSAALNREIDKIIESANVIDKQIGTITHDINRQALSIFNFSFALKKDHQNFTVNIYARNGYFQQKFNFFTEQGFWHMKSILTKSISEKDNVTLRELQSDNNGPWVVKIVR